MIYRHKIVQGLADLIEKYGGGGKDPMMRAIWYGVKGQIPTLLQTLDASESAVSEIRSKLMEVLDVEEYIEKEVKARLKVIKAKVPPKKAKPAAEVELTVEPAPEKSDGN